MSERPPRFLAIDDVLRLHRIAIEDQRGDASLRDRGLLESALAMPQQMFGGAFLHPSIPEMAAAYAFHLCKNHPFVDGNKRAAFAALVSFLTENQWRLRADPEEAATAVLRVAGGEVGKDWLADWVRTHASELPRMDLREFFAQLDGQRFARAFLSMLPAETGSNPLELVQSAVEAALAMPALRELARQQEEALAKGDQHGWEKVTMVMLTFVTIHRLAEEAGYEW